MASYSSTPVLAKIKIGNQCYWMKDADARAAIDGLEGELAEKFKLYATIEYVDGKIADEVARADAKYATATDLAAAILRIAALENTVGDSTKGLVKGLADEIVRAKAAEEANATAISEEETRAKGIEEGLRTDVDLKATKTYVDEELAKKQNVINADNKLDADYLKDGQVNHVFTAEDDTKLGSIAAGAQVNVLEGVQVNGVDLTITNKKVNVDISGKVDKEDGKGLVEATKVASYDTHIADGDIHVTAAQKTAWSGKQDALDADQLAAVNSGITATKVTKLDGISEGANKVEVAAEKAGKIKIDGVEKQIMPDNIAIDADYKHITVTSSSVSDGTNTFNAYDDTAIKGLISAEESRAKGVEGGLDTRIQNLEARGRFLSAWNSNTGLPVDYPSIAVGEEYPYKAGDYYIVGSIEGGVQYQPDGEKITRDASGYNVPKKAETREVGVGDYYIYTKTGWVWIQNSEKTVNFSAIAGDARDNNSLKGEFEALESADTALDGRITTLEGASHSHSNKALLDTYDQTNADIKSAVEQKHSHSNKDELDLIASGDKAKWDDAYTKRHEHSNKTLLDGIVADSLLDDGQKAKLNGIEAGAEVNIIETVKVDGVALTPDANRAVDIVGKANKSYVDEELAKKQDASALKELAFKDKADVVADVVSKTVSGVTASYTPAGSVAVALNNNTIQSKKTDGVAPSFTEGAYTPASISEGFFSAGSQASYSHSGFSGGSLGDASKAKFANKVMKLSAGTGDDAECLIVSYVDYQDEGLASNFADAVTAQGAYTAAVYGTDNFVANTLPSIDTTKFDGGSKVADTFNAGSMPVFEEKIVGVASASFEGTAGVANVGDIVVPAQNAVIKDKPAE